MHFHPNPVKGLFGQSASVSQTIYSKVRKENNIVNITQDNYCIQTTK